MTVSAILGEKGHTVVSLTSAAPLHQVCQTLTANRIGAVLIIDGVDIAGIVSERDVVRIISREGAGALDRPASEFMTKKLVTCGRDDSVASVMEQMTTGRFRHVPVLENSTLVGVISIGDVVKYRIAETEREAEEMRNYIASG
jgi:CBS domain-containing protein